MTLTDKWSGIAEFAAGSLSVSSAFLSLPERVSEIDALKGGRASDIFGE